MLPRQHRGGKGSALRELPGSGDASPGTARGEGRGRQCWTLFLWLPGWSSIGHIPSLSLHLLTHLWVRVEEVKSHSLTHSSNRDAVSTRSVSGLSKTQ